MARSSILTFKLIASALVVVGAGVGIYFGQQELAYEQEIVSNQAYALADVVEMQPESPTGGKCLRYEFQVSETTYRSPGCVGVEASEWSKALAHKKLDITYSKGRPRFNKPLFAQKHVAQGLGLILFSVVGALLGLAVIWGLLTAAAPNRSEA